jgi:hypothetical protein
VASGGVFCVCEVVATVCVYVSDMPASRDSCGLCCKAFYGKKKSSKGR